MKDILEELAAAHRELGKGSLPAGEAYAVVLRRRYDAQIAAGHTRVVGSLARASPPAS